jgi:cell division protein FtsW
MRQRLSQIDDRFLLAILVLVVFGVLVVYTASYAAVGRLSHADNPGDPYGYLKQQVCYALVGLAAMLAIALVPTDKLARWSRWLLVLAAVLLILVFTRLGEEGGGARRWIHVGSIRFQPSEFAKIALVLFLARFLVDKRAEVRSFSLCVRALVITGAVCLLVLAEPDLGTAVMLFLVTVAMLFLGGARLSHILVFLLLGAGSAVGFALTQPYMAARLDGWYHPLANADTSGFHVLRMLVALANGGPWGVGLGEGVEKWVIPARDTDSVYCVVGEETGLLGCTALLIIFLIFAKRGLDVARRSREPYTRLVAAGLSVTISMQVLLNLAVATASLPVTGITLPFISRGGSSLVMMLLAAGILLGASSRVPRALKPSPVPLAD